MELKVGHLGYLSRTVEHIGLQTLPSGNRFNINIAYICTVIFFKVLLYISSPESPLRLVK